MISHFKYDFITNTVNMSNFELGSDFCRGCFYVDDVYCFTY